MTQQIEAQTEIINVTPQGKILIFTGMLQSKDPITLCNEYIITKYNTPLYYVLDKNDQIHLKTHYISDIL